MSRGSRFRDEYGELRAEKIFSILMVIGIIFAVFGALFAFTMFYRIGVGDAGMIVDPVTNSISEPKPGATFGVKMPWQTLKVFPYARESLGMFGDGTDPHADFPAISGISNDGLVFQLDILARWSIDLDKLKDLYQSYPAGNWEEIAMASLIRKETRDGFSNFTGIQVIEQREMVEVALEKRLIDAIETAPSLENAIINLELELRDLEPPTRWLQAIENKTAAEQRKIQAQYDKERTIILAEAEAEKLQLEAQGRANATLIRAEGTANAIQKISNETGIPKKEITQQYIAWSYLKDIAEEEGSYFIVSTDAEGQPYLYQLPP